MQTKRPPARRSIWESGIWYLFAALPVGVGLLMGSLFLIAAMMLVADAADWMLSCMAGIALIVSGYGMGRFAGFRCRHSGLKTGVLCGLTLYLLLVVGGLIWRSDVGGFLRPFLLVTSGAWGGVTGVNRKHRRPPK